MITVQVKLYATLRQRFPSLRIGEAMPVELPDGSTVAQLVQELDIEPDLAKVVFVNNRVRRGEQALADGDAVAIFPPVAGG
jgi:molybdopterin converting factor small subunit